MNEYSTSVKSKVGLTVLCGLGIMSVSCVHDSKKDEKEKMNILFLLADDLRWNSLACMGNSMLHTPNIDNLARDGIRFNNACVTTSICMVSRATILTGQYMSRHGIREFGVPLNEEALSHLQ